jgi:hypothetical protein
MRTHLSLLVIAALVSLMAVPGVMAAPIPVTECQVLSTNGGYYTLAANILLNSTTQCFNFTANNIVLDGQGRSINTSINGVNTIVIDGRNNITIKNVVMNTTSSTTSGVIKLLNSNNSLISNVNATAQSYGVIYIATSGAYSSYNNSILSSNISGLYPIYFDASGNAGTEINNTLISLNRIDLCATNCIYFVNPAARMIGNTTVNYNIFNSSVLTPVAASTGASNILFGSWDMNYWGRTTPVGFSDTCTDVHRDKTCDSPYTVFGSLKDRYPKNASNFYDYAVIGMSWNPKILETQYSIYNISFVSGTALSNVTLWLNGSLTTATLTPTYTTPFLYYNISLRAIVNNLQGAINNTNVSFSWNYSSSANINSSTQQSVLAERLLIIPCAVPMANVTINFSTYDEDNFAMAVKTNFSTSFIAWVDSGSRNYSYNNNGAVNNTFCIFPGWATYKMNISATYKNSSYSDRNYFSQGNTYSNTTTTVNLYSLSFLNSTNIYYTIYNTNKVPLSNVIVNVLRYFPATGLFQTVAYGLTGYDGNVMIPLKLYEYYQYVITSNGVSITSTGSSQLSSITQQIYASPLNYISLFDYIDGVYASCNIINTTTTKAISCTVNDQSGRMTYSSLTVKMMRPANYTVTVCSVNGTTGTYTLVCDLLQYQNKTLYYSFVGNFQGTPATTNVLSAGTISWGSALVQWGMMGVFLAMLIVITMFFGGLSSGPDVSIALGSIGILISSLLGLINIGWGNTIPLLLASAIIIYKMGDD